MITEFLHTLRKNRGAILGWGLGLAFYSVLMVALYDSVKDIANFEQFLESYPEEIFAFFGNLTAFTTPPGYLDTYYFGLMYPIIGILAVGMGANLITGQEERGQLDLVMAHPVSRTGLFWGRWLGMSIGLIIVMLLSWLAWYLPPQSADLGLTALELLYPFLPLFAILEMFGTLALLLSLVLPSARSASMTSGLLLVGNFLVVGLSNINSDLEEIVKYTPAHYYQGGLAVNGLEWGWLAGILGTAVLLALLSWLAFVKRDIRVGGEHGWKLLSRLSKKR